MMMSSTPCALLRWVTLTASVCLVATSTIVLASELPETETPVSPAESNTKRTGEDNSIPNNKCISRFRGGRVENQILFSDPSFVAPDIFPLEDHRGNEERGKRDDEEGASRTSRRRGLKVPPPVAADYAKFLDNVDELFLGNNKGKEVQTYKAMVKQCSGAIGTTSYQNSQVNPVIRGMHAAELPQPNDIEAIDRLFEDFIKDFGRSYSGPDEKHRRRQCFEANLAAARAQQALDPSASYGITQFMDEDLDTIHRRRRASFDRSITEIRGDGGGLAPVGAENMRRATIEEDNGNQDETQQYYFINLDAVETTAVEELLKTKTVPNTRFNAAKPQEGPNTRARLMKPSALSSIDWREYGVVSPVKNQGNCGSCWSFSVTGNVESLWVISGNNATLLSEEEMIACDNKGHNDGCDGGLMQAALIWIRKYRNGYLSSAASYPFTSNNGRTAVCNISRGKPGAYISDWGEIRRTEQTLASAVSTIGPISIGIDSRSWDYYIGGIMTACISGALDHAALVVGFDSDNSPPYWIVKNSWGANWGEQGYIRIKMGQNLCLIADIPCTALVPAGLTPLPDVVYTTPEPNSAPLAPSVGFLTMLLFALLVSSNSLLV